MAEKLSFPGGGPITYVTHQRGAISWHNTPRSA